MLKIITDCLMIAVCFGALIVESFYIMQFLEVRKEKKKNKNKEKKDA